MSVTVTQGTQTPIYSLDNGGTEIQVIKLDIGSGTTIQDFGGTITAVANLIKGTVTKVEGGTIGNIISGTVDTIGLLNANAFSTTVTTGTTTLGTIKAGVNGSVIYITDIVISAGSATTLVVGNGGTNLPLLGTLSFAQYGGMVGNFRTPIFGSSGSAIVYQQSVGCPLSITANGYIK
jgi:hypothetical protein